MHDKLVLWTILPYCFVQINIILGHGRLKYPPSRGSMFRYGYNNPPDYNDNELNCGGFHNQVFQNGKCGICGDPYQYAIKPHEVGGIYANGIITGTYISEDVIRVVVEITANHKGYFEFRLCVNNNVFREATQDCLDEHVLQLADGTGTRYPLDPDVIHDIEILLQLPNGITCTQCVLQWKYTCGNNWGIDPDGTKCVGCGDQEQFYGCSDISIVDSAMRPISNFSSDNDVSGTPPAPIPTPLPILLPNFIPFPPAPPINVVPLPQTPSFNAIPLPPAPPFNATPLPLAPPINNNPFPPPPPSNPNAVPLPPSSLMDNCYSIAAGMTTDTWCQVNCGMGFCPDGLCACIGRIPDFDCLSFGILKSVDHDRWCQTNCNLNFCPSSLCRCEAT